MVRSLTIRSIVTMCVLLQSSASIVNAGPRDFFATTSGPFPFGMGASGENSSSAPATDLFGDQPPKRIHIYRSIKGRSIPHTESFCVRSCDGRYFPVPAHDDENATNACNHFCPASDTTVFRGTSIDAASNSEGKLYSATPNAYRYRDELVANCTCNGVSAGGFSPIRIEDDPTLRKGDIVSTAEGLKVVGTRNEHTGLILKPPPMSIASQYRNSMAAMR